MAAKQEPERIRLDLNKIVEEAVLFVRHDIESRAIELSVKLAPDLPWIAGDRVQLQQVIVNLFVNSPQAIDQTGDTAHRIALATYVGDDSRVGFSILDSGPDIVNQELDRVFAPFFTTKDQGVGIGLAICQSIISAHHGSIAVSNHPDGGARFRFSLPVGEAPSLD
jgi:two-component system sensor kinase FixL